MRTFIAHSPLVLVSTVDEGGHLDVSPKGDPPGFVQIDDDGDLLIPERLGNRLTFGFHNILRNGEIGLLSVVPNERETLRVKGRATLHHDPEVVAGMAVGDARGDPSRALGARGFAALGGDPDEAAVAMVSQHLEQSYCDELY